MSPAEKLLSRRSLLYASGGVLLGSIATSLAPPTLSVFSSLLDTFTTSLPYKVTFIGPLKGEYRAFGIGQLRGGLAALRNFFEHINDQHPTFESIFSVSTIDESDGRYLRTDYEKFAKEFDAASQNSSVVIGPCSSETASNLLLKPVRKLRSNVLLVTAGSSHLRTHPEYGTRLFSLAASIDSYARQLMQYFIDYTDPRPSRVVCLYRDDEYGKAGKESIEKYGVERNMPVSAAAIPREDISESDSSEYASRLNVFINKQQRQFLPKTLVVLVDVGFPLQKLNSMIRKSHPEVATATTTSIEPGDLWSNEYDGITTLYSYVPSLVTEKTLRFHKYCRLVETRLLDLGLESDELPSVGTIDAEVYDSTLYWLESILYEQLSGGVFRSNQHYATEISISGTGASLQNRNALFLFQVAGSKLQSIQIPSL